MADKKQKIILSFVVDKTSLKKAQSAIAGLNKSFVVLDKSATQSSMASVAGVEAVAKAAKDSKSSVAELGDELSGRVTASGEELKRIMKELGTITQKSGKDGKKAFSDLDKAAANALDEFEKIIAEVNDLEGDAPQAIKKITKEVTNLNKALKKTGSEIGENSKAFDDISRDVSNAGDVESQSLAIAGAIGTFGGAQLEQNIGAGAEVFAVIEALPKLKEAARGMPSVIGAFATSLGPTGIGLIAVAGLAAIAVSGLVSGMQKQAEAAKALIAAEETFFTIRETGTKETAQAELDANETQLSILRARRESLVQLESEASQVVAETLSQEKNLFVALGRGLADLMSSDAAEEFGKELETIDKEMIGLLDTNKLLIQGLVDNEFATGAASDSLEELNKQVLANAKSEADVVRFKLDQQDKTTAQLEDENRAREKSLTVIEAQIKAIVDSGEVNEQTAEEMVKLQEAGRGLLSQMRFVADTAIPAANALEELAKAAEDQTIAAEEATAAAEKVVSDETSLGRQRSDVVIQTLENIAAAEKNHADELVKLSEQAAAAEQKVLDDLTNRLVKLREDGGRRETDAVRKEQQRGLEAQIKAQRQVVDDSLSHVRALQDIQQKAADDEIGLRQSRDFRGVVNARRAARIQIQGAQKDFTRQQKDRVADQLRAKDDRARAFAQERNDRLLKYQQDINDARNQARQQRIDAVNAGRQAILDARAKQIQELSDIRDSGIQALTMRRQLAAAELQLIGQMTGTAAQLFSQLSSQLSGFTGNNNQTVNNTSNSTTTATTNNNIGAINVGSGGHSIMRALVR